MQRRTFLRTAATASALTAAPSIISAQEGTSVDRGGNGAERLKKGLPLRVSLIGSGWYGNVDLGRLLEVSNAEVVSVCDPDQKMMDETAARVAGQQKSGNTPAKVKDYRDVLKAHTSGEAVLDAVIIGTPDHWHALPCLEACEAGLDVWVQKPISVDVMEGKAMLDAARKHDRVVQVGMQRRSTPHLAQAKREIVEAGKLGEIAHAEVCCYYHMRNGANPPVSEPPATFDYDLWTGPAPMRPYTPMVHPRTWRAFMEYSNGILGDMCVHMYDATRWMLGLGWPQEVYSSGGILVDNDAAATTPDTQTATFDHRHEQHALYPDGLQVVWTHRSWGNAPDPEFPWALFIYGSEGTLKADVNKYTFVPRRGEKVTVPFVDETDKFPGDNHRDINANIGPAVRAHMNNWLECIQSREKPVSDIEQGHISTASCILANISMKLGRSLAWDPEKHEVPGDEEANALLKREYRAPWQHPAG